MLQINTNEKERKEKKTLSRETPNVHDKDSVCSISIFLTEAIANAMVMVSRLRRPIVEVRNGFCNLFDAS